MTARQNMKLFGLQRPRICFKRQRRRSKNVIFSNSHQQRSRRNMADMSRRVILAESLDAINVHHVSLCCYRFYPKQSPKSMASASTDLRFQGNIVLPGRFLSPATKKVIAIGRRKRRGLERILIDDRNSGSFFPGCTIQAIYWILVFHAGHVDGARHAFLE